MKPVGYILMQHAERMGRPTKAYAKWQERLPGEYQQSVLGCAGHDNYQIKLIKHYRSLMPMAMEARKPMFLLTSADGAIGAHQTNVQQCYTDFEELCRGILQRVGIS
jgi:hypothetical protein